MSTNLVQHKPPSEERSFSLGRVTGKALSIIKKAMHQELVDPTLFDKVAYEYRRSEMDTSKLMEDFHRIDMPYFEYIKDDHFENALLEVSQAFLPPFKWRPVHFCDLRYYPWPLDSSAELPYTEDPKLRKLIAEAHAAGDTRIIGNRMSFHNCYNAIFEKSRVQIHDIKEGHAKGMKYLFANKAHARAHLVAADDPDKIRMVYGVPKLTLFAEAMFLWPLMSWMNREKSTPILWGYETMTGGLYRIMAETSTRKTKCQTFLAFDWRMFDKSALYAVMDRIHDVWYSAIDLDQGYIPTQEYPDPVGSPKHKEKMTNLWKWMTRAVKYAPVRLPDGSEWVRRHNAISSGFFQTQLMDSWYNAVMIVTILKSLGFDTSPEKMYLKIMGDDSFIGLSEYICPEDYEGFKVRFAEEAKRRFNATLNVKKSEIGPSPDGLPLLGYINKGGIPYRDTAQLLAQLSFPERYWDIDRMAARAIGIAYASCGVSDEVYRVCKNVYDYCRKQSNNEPNPLGSDWLRYMNILDIQPDLSKFPTMEDITSRLLNPEPSRGPTEVYFPDHFLANY